MTFVLPMTVATFDTSIIGLPPFSTSQTSTGEDFVQGPEHIWHCFAWLLGFWKSRRIKRKAPPQHRSPDPTWELPHTGKTIGSRKVSWFLGSIPRLTSTSYSVIVLLFLGWCESLRRIPFKELVLSNTPVSPLLHHWVTPTRNDSPDHRSGGHLSLSATRSAHQPCKRNNAVKGPVAAIGSRILVDGRSRYSDRCVTAIELLATPVIGIVDRT